MATKDRQREIARFLLKGAQDISGGLSRAKTARKAAWPCMRGFFGVDMPTKKEVDEVAKMNMAELLE